MKRKRTRVVVAGCGFGGLAVVRELCRRARGPIDVVAFNTQPFLYNYPVLPRVLGGQIAPGDATIPLEELLAGCDVDLRIEPVKAIDTLASRVQTRNGSLGFDALVVAVGSRARPIAQDPGVFVFYPKSARHLERLHQNVTHIARRGAARSPPTNGRPYRFAVAGGGLSGIEFASALRQWADRRCQEAGTPPDRIEVRLFEQHDRLAPRYDPRLGQRLLASLARQRVRVSLDRAVLNVGASEILTSAGSEPADCVLCCIGSEPNLGRMGLTGLSAVEAGFQVDEHLRVAVDPTVFAVGDVVTWGATRGFGTRLKTAHHAIHQGRHVACNILRQLRGIPLRPYRPRDTAVAVSLGSRTALVAYRDLNIGGTLAGRIKQLTETAYLLGYRAALRRLL